MVVLLSECEGVWTSDCSPGQGHGPCSLVEHDLTTGTTVREILGGLEDPALSPRYSPDRSRIAFLRGKDLAVVDSESGSELLVVENLTLHSSYGWAFDGYLRWSRDGSHLYVNIDRSHPGDEARIITAGGSSAPVTITGQMVEVDPASATVSEVESLWEGDAELKRPERDRRLSWRQRGEIYLTTTTAEAPDGSRISDTAYPPANPANAMLLGSRDHPVRAPIWSPRGRYYFYFHYTNGWFSEEEVDGFDCLRGIKFHVKTLRRHLYSE